MGGLGYAAAIILRIHKDGKETTVTFPPGSAAAVGNDGHVDVTLPGQPGAAAPPDGSAARPEATPTRFRTAAVTRGDLTMAIRAEGTIQPEEVVNVSAQVEGPVVKLGDDPRGKTDPNFKGKSVDFNTPVDVGTVLAEIDLTVYKPRCVQATAELENAKADLKGAEVKVGQAKAGEKVNAASPGTLPPAEATLQLAEASLAAAQAAVVRRQAGLDLAKTNLDRTIIRSPVKGTIIDRRVNLGQNVSPASGSLFVIAKDIDKLQVLADVYAGDVGCIAAGMDVRITVDAFPGEVFGGKVSRIRRGGESLGAGNYTVVVAIDKPDRRLTPDMRVHVSFLLEARNVLRVPSVALRYSPRPEQAVPEFSGAIQSPGENQRTGPNGTGTLWVVAEDGKLLRPIEVQCGATDGELTAVSGTDVKEGTEVVTGELVGANEGIPHTSKTSPAKVEVPEGSSTVVSANGAVNVQLPAAAPPKVAVIRPSVQSTPDYLETTGKIIAGTAEPGTPAARPAKYLQFHIDRKTFARMFQAAKKRNPARAAAPNRLGAADDPFAVGGSSPPALPPSAPRPSGQ